MIFVTGRSHEASSALGRSSILSQVTGGSSSVHGRVGFWKGSSLDPSKSQDEFYLDLLCQLIASDPLEVTSHKNLMRDTETLRNRFSHEGLSFLTKSLPKLGKALDRGLASLKFQLPREFKHSHSNRSIPAFLQAYFNLIFCEDGSLLEEAPPGAVKHLRQVLFFAYKLELPYPKSLEDSVLQRFIEVEDELRSVVLDDAASLLDLAASITKDVFKDFDPFDILPRHGPGAVATGEFLEEKWEFSRLYNKIHQCYPYYRYYIAGRGQELADRRDWYFSMQRLESGTAKVVLVPKDSRGPRLISAEPLEYQWIQQGLGRKLARHLEYVSTYTKFRVNFTSQEINRSLALNHSIDRAMSTLDLQDASDRVSLEVVRRVFKDTPQLLRCLEATRSEATTMPDGTVVPLAKFAPMGSALCFPVEAYIFWVVLVASAVLEARMPLKRACRSVYVYGDDIIVPTHGVDRCIRALESIGLVVNRNKTCISGPFRESCGMDAFKGAPVTPFRLKVPFSDRDRSGTVLSSYCALANHLGADGYQRAADLIWGEIRRSYGPVPYGTANSSFPCRITSSPQYAMVQNRRMFRSRWNRRYQLLEFNLLSVVPTRRKSRLDDWPRLLRAQVLPGDEDPAQVVIPRSTRIKRGWRAV